MNLGQTPATKLEGLFREKNDRGALDVDMSNLSQFWRELSDAQKRELHGTLLTNSIKEVEKHEKSLDPVEEKPITSSKSTKTSNYKNVNIQVQIKEKQAWNERSQILQQKVEEELSFYIEMSLSQGHENELIKSLAFAQFGNTHYR